MKMIAKHAKNLMETQILITFSEKAYFDWRKITRKFQQSVWMEKSHTISISGAYYKRWFYDIFYLFYGTRYGFLLQEFD